MRVNTFSYKLVGILRQNNDGSFATKEARKKILHLAGQQLHELGLKVNNPGTLKPKHAMALIAHWKSQDFSAGTIKNRISHLRWLAKKTNNAFVKPDNEKYGVANRVYVARESRAVEFTNEQLEAIKDPYVSLSAELQKEFGLRREEAIKFQVSFADRHDHIVIKPSWSKGGKGRVIPITSNAQRESLRRAHNFCGKGALIPPNSNYRAQRRVFEKQMHAVGLGKSHGARHHYAQNRYRELTGFECKH